MILPDILSDDIQDIQSKIDTLVGIPNHPTHLHLDVIDGFFADNLTLMPSDYAHLDFHDCTFEVHLMANDPEDYLGEIAGSGSQGVITQIEHLRDRSNFIQVTKQLKLGLGFALDLYTPVSELSNEDLLYADVILLMSVKVGFSHQTFNPEVLKKMKALRDRGFTKPIEVDGGVNPSNVPQLIHAGATHLAVNSALWDDNVAENLKALQNSLKEPARDQNS